ncbi:conserved hypothetical protein [Sphingomonas sp. EC-HK361]|uniref:YdeI/OmpD-associated family protein n=1 Tax=Sphingomonas sp. EC-HK361 TaxID=2038397 RepID=UPI001255A5AC|nr:YdeI/OmpD-associated family protein [Sphingomonas sp. EC-HK361]VVT13815.1 conserved hypothetical protein [Sphingomonas sp. EC-HK361]
MSETRAGLPIVGFPDADAWEAWLAGQGEGAAGLWLKLAKKGNVASALTRAQAIDGALIHGWIDGQLDAYDDAWWLIRFTPRKARSRWSEKNRTRAIALIAEGRVADRGAREIAAAQADGRWDAAYAPQSTAAVPDDLAEALDASPGARAFFDALDGANRYAILHRVAEAKRAETRAARVVKFVAMCAAGETIYPPRGRRGTAERES